MAELDGNTNKRPGLFPLPVVFLYGMCLEKFIQINYYYKEIVRRAERCPDTGQLFFLPRERKDCHGC